MKAVFIVNPRSAGGGTGKRLFELRGLIGRVFPSAEVKLTERSGHASDLAAETPGADLVVAVGGDGTANEVVNGLARIESSARPCLGVLPAGTGSDLVKTLGTPRGLSEALTFLRDGPRRPTDWLRVRFESSGVDRYCINVAGFGMNGQVVRRANASSKRLGGQATFALATLRTVLGWKAPRVEVGWDGPDGEGSWTGELASVFVANGQYCGGGMWVGRGGDMGDGAAEVTILPDLPVLTMARQSSRLYDGTIGGVPEVVRVRATHLTARTIVGGPVLVDVDGEQPGKLPISVEVEPAALRVVRD